MADCSAARELLRQIDTDQVDPRQNLYTLLLAELLRLNVLQIAQLATLVEQANTQTSMYADGLRLLREIEYHLRHLKTR